MTDEQIMEFLKAKAEHKRRLDLDYEGFVLELAAERIRQLNERVKRQDIVIEAVNL